MIHKITIALCSMLMFGIYSRAHATHAGDLDPSFGTSGKVIGRFPNVRGGTALTSLAIVPGTSDIIATGFNIPITLSLSARYRSNGSIDSSFGEDRSRMFVWDRVKTTASTLMRSNTLLVTGGSAPFAHDSTAPHFLDLKAITLNGKEAPQFNNSGNQWNVRGEIRALAIDSRNRIVAAGYADVAAGGAARRHQFVVARALSTGVRDQSFNGAAGAVTTHMSYGNPGHGDDNNEEVILGVAALPNDALVVAGTARIRDENRFILARYTEQGSLDSTFNRASTRAGTVEVNFAPLAGPLPSGIPRVDRATAVTTQTVDGITYIVAVGLVRTHTNRWSLGVVRYNLDGTPDTTFGQSVQGQRTGMIVDNFDGFNVQAYGVTIDNNNKIIVVGSYQHTTNALSQFIVARYTTQGQSDATFGNQGKNITTMQEGAAAIATTVSQDNNNNLVVGGFIQDSTGVPYFALARYRGDELEPVFNNDNPLVFPGALASESRDIALDSLGRIVSVGFTTHQTSRRFALARLLRDGSLDPYFGTNGLVNNPFSTEAQPFEQINSVTIGADDTIIVAGESIIGGNSRFVLARYTPRGILDTTFGDLVNPNVPTGPHTGKIITNFTSLTGNQNPNDSAHIVTLERNGNIIAAGYALNKDGTFSIAVARYLPQGILDPTFGSLVYELDETGPRTGMLISDFKTVSVKAESLVIEQNGSLLIAGSAIAPLSATSKQVSQQFIVARYHANGTPDTHFGSHGKILTKFNSNGSVVHAMAMSDANKVLVAGYNFATHGVARIALARYLHNGTIDNDFGDRGTVTTEPHGVSGHTIATAVLALSQGRTVIAGHNIATENPTAFIAQYTDQGKLDGTFGNNGIITVPSLVFNAVLRNPRDTKQLSFYTSGSLDKKMIVQRYTR